MSVVVYHYPTCGTCKKARKWLEARGVAHELVDIVAAPPPAQTLRDFIQRSGLPARRFFNTSGQSYRDGGWKERMDTLTVDDAAEALAADGKLIKRPLVDTGEAVLVGFDEATWSERL